MRRRGRTICDLKYLRICLSGMKHAAFGVTLTLFPDVFAFTIRLYHMHIGFFWGFFK